jgi:serine/threonine-protein kinase
LERLGAGGMATVFLAEDERLGRQVAVKRLHADSPEDAARRFQREAKVGASLSHPGLVTVFDTVADDEGVLIVMEYVQGENLAQLMARERVAPERAMAIVRALAAALDYAHQAGVIHRDVKPANVLVSPDGKAKLVDLGIASVTERTQITAVGTVLGTPSYMAPEQLEGGKLSKAVDIYALATVAFELLAGRKAVQGRTPVEIAHKLATAPPPDLRDSWSDAPPAAAELLMRAMSRDPADRPATAGELAGGLEQALRQPRAAVEPPTEPTQAMQATPPPAPPAPPRRATPAASRRAVPGWLPLAAVIAALVVSVGAIAAIWGGAGDKAQAPVIPAKKKDKPKKKSQPAQAAPQTETAPATTTGEAPTASTGKNPAVGSQLHNQAFQLANQGKYDEAIALERRAIPMLEGSSGMDYWYALYNLGHALRLAGHPDEAIPILEQRLKHPNQRGTVEAELKKARKEAGKG